MSTYIKIPTEDSTPFIFGSMNYAAAANGATVWVYDTGDGVVESGTYPIENIIDGNRATFASLSKIAKFYPAHGVVRFDLSDSLPSGKEINYIVLENDINIPLRAIRVLSYSDALFTTGLTEHTISRDVYLLITSPPQYYYGVNPKVDGITLGVDDNPSIDGEFDCIEGRNLFLFLDEPIVNPYVDLRFYSAGRNAFGIDGTMDKGLWVGAVNETIETADPLSGSLGVNDNYMQLATTIGGADKYSRWFDFGIRPDWTYQFTWCEKMTGAGVTGRAKIEVEYLDKDKDSLGSDVIYDQYPAIVEQTWGDGNRKRKMINIPYLGGRYSADGNDLHEVPEGSYYARFRFVLEADSSVTLTWKIEDMQFHSINIPAKIADIQSYAYDSAEVKQRYTYLDMSGEVRIRRIGMHSYNFSTSKKPSAEAYLQDLGGKAGANFLSLSESAHGKVVMEDIHGVVSGQFVPKSGVKQRRGLQMICPKEQRLYMIDLYQSSTPFSIVDPQGDWADYIIEPGTMTWNVSGPPSMDKQEDYLWIGNMTVREV